MIKSSIASGRYHVQVTIAAIAGLAVILVLPLSLANAQGQGQGRGKGNSAQQHGKKSQAQGNQGGQQSGGKQKGSVGGTLVPTQFEQLVRMLEEEKLARDVYLALSKSSGLQIFNAIAKSEAQHMQAVEKLVSSHSPAAVVVKNLPAGSFSNPQFQTLYESLVASGIASPIDAVKVGIRIEEMDIKDLETLLSQNPSQEVARVLEHLQRGSEHHLRAFVGELKRLGGVNTSQIPTQNDLSRTANAENGRKGSGQMNKTGEPFGKGKSNKNEHQAGPNSKN